MFSGVLYTRRVSSLLCPFCANAGVKRGFDIQFGHAIKAASRVTVAA